MEIKTVWLIAITINVGFAIGLFFAPSDMPDRVTFLKACGYKHNAEYSRWEEIGYPDYSLLTGETH